MDVALDVPPLRNVAAASRRELRAKVVVCQTLIRLICEKKEMNESLSAIKGVEEDGEADATAVTVLLSLSPERTWV